MCMELIFYLLLTIMKFKMQISRNQYVLIFFSAAKLG